MGLMCSLRKLCSSPSLSYLFGGRGLIYCEEMNLAISFVRNSGVNLLRPLYLESLKNNTVCKLVVDTKQRISEQNALKTLVNDGFIVKNFVGKGSFHVSCDHSRSL